MRDPNDKRFLSNRHFGEYATPAQKHLYEGQYLTVKELAALIGVTVATVYKRLRAGYPLDEPRRSGKQPKLYHFRGQLLTAKQIARIAGVHQTTVYKRVSGRYVLEGADLKDPNHEPPINAKMITYKGRTLHKREWARELGMHPSTFVSRLRDGWTMDRIINESVGTSKYTVRRYNRKTIKRIIEAFHTQTGGYEQTSPRSLRDRPGSFVPERGNSDISISKGFSA